VDGALLLKIARDRLERAEGVAAVAVADGFPLDGDYRYARIRRDGTRVVRAETTRVSPGYLETIGARILRGRAITSEDQPGRERTVVLSEPLAALLFPQSEPLGQQMELVLEDDRIQTYRIVGVTADLVSSQLETAKPQLFVALSQHPTSRVLMIARSANAAAAEAAMASTFEHALADFQLEEGVVRSSLESADHRLESNRTELAMGSVAAGVGSAVALLLAALGVFGVIGFMVATRTREIGIRIALGASRSRVRSTVLFDALKLVVPGVIGGLLLAVPLVQELSWYSLGIVEPLAYFVAAAITLGVTLLAGWPAARRAAAVEPMSAMRAE
jgi:putative ABC transport system permease protein